MSLDIPKSVFWISVDLVKYKDKNDLNQKKNWRKVINQPKLWRVVIWLFYVSKIIIQIIYNSLYFL